MSVYKKLLVILASSVFVISMGSAIGKTASMKSAQKAAVVTKVKAAPVNVNTADVKTLTKVKGINKKRANAIVKYREKNGNFTSVSDLSKVKGFGKKMLKKVEGALTV